MVPLTTGSMEVAKINRAEEYHCMSRTKSGSKGPGHEYWSNRPGNRHGGLLGRAQKRWTHRAERRIGRLLERHQDTPGDRIRGSFQDVGALFAPPGFRITQAS